jgi:hypothetical protein
MAYAQRAFGVNTMKAGDLAKVKDDCAFGGVYMQGIAGRKALVLSLRERKPDMVCLSCFVLVGGKKYLVWISDLENIS